MAETRREIVIWLGSNIVPHEAHLRLWLRRMAIPKDEIDDIVQDAYLAISRLASVQHIRSGRSYLFQTAKSLILQKIRHERIVPIDRLSDLDLLELADEAPGPDRCANGRQELERVRSLIAALPDRCREIFELRRIQGVPQQEIAARLGLPEHTVEAQAIRGLKLILKAIAGEDAAVEAKMNKTQEYERGTNRDR